MNTRYTPTQRKKAAARVAKGESIAAVARDLGASTSTVAGWVRRAGVKSAKPGGRPKVFAEDLPDGWQAKVLELAEVGASDVELRAELGISRALWDRLLDEDEAFSTTIKRAADLCQAWWERQGRTSLTEKDFSATLWYMNMKNRFGWRDRQEVSGPEGEPLFKVYGGIDPDRV